MTQSKHSGSGNGSTMSARVQDYLDQYFRTLRDQPVRATIQPGALKQALPPQPPQTPERFDSIFADFIHLAERGITHWNHPRFFAYFPCSTSPIALAAEQLAAALSQQGMLWQTSPLSTELEEVCVDWMIQLLGLEGHGFRGLMNDTASTSTFSAVVMAREKATRGQAKIKGLSAHAPLRVYVSPEAHSSIKKAVWMAGLGLDNVVEIVTGKDDKMSIKALRAQIAKDRANGAIPAMLVGAAGGTSVGAFDDLAAMGEIARDEGLFFHIDAAWAGVAAIAPEFRPYFTGWAQADSVVLNPHKWLMTGMECSILLVKDMGLLHQSMAIVPSYLETHGKQDFINYSEHTPQLGRPFRSLKLWFVIRYFGARGLADALRNHVNWSVDLCERLRQHPKIEITTEPSLSLFSFALTAGDTATLDLVNRINDDGRIYLTQSTYKGRSVIRFVTGTANCTAADVAMAGDVIEELVDKT